MTSISSSTLTTMASQTSDATTSAASTYNQFLTLLTTQLQNQDPLDPMESQEFTNQLVQFSQVEQAILSNEKLDTLLSQVNSSQIGPSLNYIGKDVYYQGSSVYYEGDDIKLGFAVDGEPASGKIHIYDEDDQLVRSIDLPANTISGSVTWDGLDDQGVAVDKDKTYTLKISALDEENQALDGYTGVPAHVEGIETINGVLYLAINGDRRIEASSVLSVSNPDVKETDTTTDTTTGTDTTES